MSDMRARSFGLGFMTPSIRASAKTELVRSHMLLFKRNGDPHNSSGGKRVQGSCERISPEMYASYSGLADVG